AGTARALETMAARLYRRRCIAGDLIQRSEGTSLFAAGVADSAASGESWDAPPRPGIGLPALDGSDAAATGLNRLLPDAGLTKDHLLTCAARPHLAQANMVCLGCIGMLSITPLNPDDKSPLFRQLHAQ